MISLKNIAKLACASLILFPLAGCSSSNPDPNIEAGVAVTSYRNVVLSDVFSQLDAKELDTRGVRLVDVSGRSRSVQDPADWKVCVQSLETGEKITTGAGLTLGVIEKDTDCPIEGVMTPLEIQDAVKDYEAIPTTENPSDTDHFSYEPKKDEQLSSLLEEVSSENVTIQAYYTPKGADVAILLKESQYPEFKGCSYSNATLESGSTVIIMAMPKKEACPKE